MFTRESSDAAEVKHVVKRTVPVNHPTFPDRIEPLGLSQERKEYLFNEIRKFCKAGQADLTAPNPHITDDINDFTGYDD